MVVDGRQSSRNSHPCDSEKTSLKLALHGSPYRTHDLYEEHEDCLSMGIRGGGGGGCGGGGGSGGIGSRGLFLQVKLDISIVVTS